MSPKKFSQQVKKKKKKREGRGWKVSTRTSFPNKKGRILIYSPQEDEMGETLSYFHYINLGEIKTHHKCGMVFFMRRKSQHSQQFLTVPIYYLGT
jgi:hypothetical protein